MKKEILFLHDTSLATPRGAELTIKQLLALAEEKGFSVNLDYLRDFEIVKSKTKTADLVILCSTSRSRFEIDLIKFLIEEKLDYIKIEFDYNFCIRRNILCTVDRKITNCCNPDKYHWFRELFKNAFVNVFQSPKHYESHQFFYGEAVKEFIVMPPTVEVQKIKVSNEKIENSIPFFGDLNYLKGGNEYLNYAENHPEISFPVYGQNQLRREIPANVTFHHPISNDEVLEILGKTKTFICQPVWPEPSGRLAAEAFLSDCEIISNDRIGTFSFDFYPNDLEKAKQEMKNSPNLFFEKVDEFFDKKQEKREKSLGKVLVYKSYGGLGDIFFCIPSLYLLNEVSDSLSFAVAPRLVNFFKKYISEFEIVNEEEMRKNEAQFDNIYELGNYPAFRGYDLPHALKYPTHKKVKQHSIRHYIDCVAKLHKDIQPQSCKRFPYFQDQPKELAYTVHPGAGFLLKIWPTEKYAELIEKIHNYFPELKCRIILGPNDPNPVEFMKGNSDYVELITGGMEEVGEAMESAIFHIGNDAGITHVAGAFNVPTVAIYGPTGPGSWGSFSEQAKIIWGKRGVCDIRCNYDVILNCDHKICLNSVTADRVLDNLFALFNQMNLPKNDNKVMFGLDVKSTTEDLAFILNNGEEELLIEFNDEKDFNEFAELMQHSFYLDEVSNPNISQLLPILIEKEFLFQLPKFL